MKHATLLAGAALVALAVPAFAGTDHRCTEDIQTCLNQMAAKLSQRGYMGLEFDKATDGQYVVKKVIETAPAARAGFKPGDVILVVNGARWSDERAMNKLNWGIGSKMSVLVQRAGEKKTLNLTLGRMPEEVMAQYIGAHMLENHVTLTVADGAHDR